MAKLGKIELLTEHKIRFVPFVICWDGSKPFDSHSNPERFFVKVYFEKKSADDNKNIIQHATSS